MTDILFISPPTPSPSEHAWYGTASPPLGILYLASNLLEHGFSVAVSDLSLAQDPVLELQYQIEVHAPRIVGFATLTQNYYLTELLVEYVRELLPDAIIWVGGPHTTYEYEVALKHSGFDVVFFFEAEESVVEVAQCQLHGRGDLANVAGIAFVQDGQLVKTQSRARQKSLDKIIMPARELVPMDQYLRPGTIMTSRGCPMKCIFCIASTFEDAYRYRSPKNVVDELRFMHETWGINDFYFIDNVFTTHRRRAREICGLIREADLPVGWYCVSRVDYVRQSLMQDLASAGCYRIELGVESGDAGVIERIRKRINIDQVRRAAEIILNLGMQPMFTFQVGHPNDTPESIEKTLALAQEMRSMGAATLLSVTTPFPGTPLLRDRDDYGITLHTDNWEDFRMSNPTYSTPCLSRNDIRKAMYREAARQAQEAQENIFKDPPSAPWIRFANGGNGVSLPPPPKKSESERAQSKRRSASDPRERFELPLLQVDQ